ncbi:hypothetical protein D7X12_38480 [Corallococcus sicarius]|uniref:Uncharacterized protein n=1 Tax=Corallococcus sicarius TaxID=2316726 RepID=A0A3A8MH98_9BACT|nr:hypothetical protein D7X12_38480 [Corallococcus sicarius]
MPAETRSFWRAWLRRAASSTDTASSLAGCAADFFAAGAFRAAAFFAGAFLAAAFFAAGAVFFRAAAALPTLFFALGAVFRRAAVASSIRPSKGISTTVALMFRSDTVAGATTSCAEARGGSECTGRETRVG